MNARFTPPAIDQLRARALHQADLWNRNADDLRTNMRLNEWRDNCRDEIRDELASEKLPPGEADGRLAAWSDAFDTATLERRVLINGFEPVSAADVSDTMVIAHAQLVAIGALFRSIARLCADRDIQLLCQHGSEQAEEAANDIDALRERATVAGLVGGAA